MGGGGGGVLLGILGGDVSPGPPNADPISDLKMSFFTPVFRPGRLKSIPVFRSRLETREIDLDWNANKKIS